MFELHRTELDLDLSRFWRGLVAVVLVLVLAVLIARVTGGHDTWSYFLATGFVALIVRSVLRERARVKEIRDFTTRIGLSYLGGSLPKSFPLHKTVSRSAHSIRRAAAGDKLKNEVVFFDCTLGQGKTRFSRTLVGTRGPAGFRTAQYGPDLVTERVGEWFIVYGSRRILEIQEIEVLISELCSWVFLSSF